jgi:hypothetical protein
MGKDYAFKDFIVVCIQKMRDTAWIDDKNDNRGRVCVLSISSTVNTASAGSS